MNLPRCAREAASKVEYVLILAVVSLALLGAATLLGRRIARMYKVTEQSLDQGKPISSTLEFPSNVNNQGATPVGPFPGPYPANDYTQFYQPLLGDTRPVVDVLGGDRKKLDDLPPSIVLPTNLKEQMRAGRRATRRDGYERGASVKPENGNIVFVNPGRGRDPTPQERAQGAGAVLSVTADPAELGSFHTHPNSFHFSHVDLFSLAHGDELKFLEGPTGKQWVLVRTQDTAPDLSQDLVNDCYTRGFRNRFMSYLESAGGDTSRLGADAPPLKHISDMSVPEIIKEAGRLAALAGVSLPANTEPIMEAMTEAGTMAVVRALGFGAYRGVNCEPLSRVDDK